MPPRDLIIGPFAGEWGWELCCWNPLARRAVQEFRRQSEGRVIVAAPAGSRYLYEFADEFVPVMVYRGTSEGLGGRACTPIAALAHKGQGTLRPDERVHGDPDRLAFRSPRPAADPQKLWRRLGPESPLGPPLADVCVAFRPPKEYRGRIYPEKAWPLEQCLELVAALQASGFRVAAIGGPDNYDAGVWPALDLRGADLACQCEVIAGARVVIGPSSAPIHLASLCGTPHVTWYGRDGRQNESSRNRYAGAWNPFRTPHTFLDPLVPTVQDVLAACRRSLSCA